MHTKQTLITLGFAFSIGALLSGCPQDLEEGNPDNCWLALGDDTCQAKQADFMAMFGEARPFCVNESMCSGVGADSLGCVAEMPTECYTPCGAQSDDNCGNADGDGDGDMTGDGDGDDMTGDGDGDGEMPCEGPEDCDGDAPFCDLGSGVCVGCDGMNDPDLACAGLGEGTPVCLAGSCVQCAAGRDDACSGLTPVCDVGASMCVGCSAHDQCMGSACNFVAGNCFDPTGILHVDGDANCGLGNGTQENPYCSIAAALAASGAEALIVLHEIGGQVEYGETTTVSKPIAMLGAAGELPRIRGAGANPALRVIGDGVLILVGVQVQSGQSAGVAIEGGNAWLERSRILNNTGGGIVVENGGMLVLENSFVGTSALNAPAISIDQGSIEIVYSTLGAAGAVGAPALSCIEASGTVRNSLMTALMTNPEVVGCDGVSFQTCAAEASLGGDNVALGDMELGWFNDYGNGGFFLTGAQPGAINTAATWQTGDPLTDINGDPRPTTDGSVDYAGADRL